MIEILLVFAINGAPEEISDRIFTSKEECSEFVNTVAQSPVIKEDGSFKFISSDGMLFTGKCINKKEYDPEKGIEEGQLI